ncbi:RNA polymerase sigma factor [Nannocystaceae bacterium ST9]
MTPEDIARALAGDRRSMAALVEGLRPIIHAEVARTLLPSAAANHRDARQDCCDLVQDVFVALLAREGAVLRSWDPQRGAKLETFVRTVAHRYVLGVLRTKSRNPYSIDPIDGDALDQQQAAESPIDSRIDARHLLAELDEGLDERGRWLFRALVVEARSTEEVAQDAGMTRNAVYAWSARLGRKLRALIEQRSDSFPAIDHNGDRETR